MNLNDRIQLITLKQRLDEHIAYVEDAKIFYIDHLIGLSLDLDSGELVEGCPKDKFIGRELPDLRVRVFDEVRSFLRSPPIEENFQSALELERKAQRALETYSWEALKNCCSEISGLLTKHVRPLAELSRQIEEQLKELPLEISPAPQVLPENTKSPPKRVRPKYKWHEPTETPPDGFPSNQWIQGQKKQLIKWVFDAKDEQSVDAQMIKSSSSLWGVELKTRTYRIYFSEQQTYAAANKRLMDDESIPKDKLHEYRGK